MKTRRITFMYRMDQPTCGVCAKSAPLAHTSHGFLCSRCVLTFLRKPHQDENDSGSDTSAEHEQISSSDMQALAASLG